MPSVEGRSVDGRSVDGRSVEGWAARRAALSILDAVLRRGQTIEAAAARATNLVPVDRALATAIVGETLRRIPDLDGLIDSATRQRLPDDSKARAVLRLALAQKIGLGTPDHAIVATALPLVDGGPRRLVHGVLGTLLRRGLPAMESCMLPAEVEQRWVAAWGEDAVFAARRLIARRPPLDLTFADDGAAQAFAEPQGGRSLAQRNVRLDSCNVADLPGFGAGGWWVQDLAASLPARLIPRGARDVLDLCAAPGGKTMQLAAVGHQVTSVDSSESRLGRLRENLQRTHLKADLVTADALQWAPDRQFDAILLDAPCSATGTYRRHPEVLYRARPRIIADNVELQSRLLDRAAGWLRPSGALVYSVCSLEAQEGEERIAAFLRDNASFEVEPPMLGELPAFTTTSDAGTVRILPGLLEEEGGLDGFFMARLVRRA
jgi:16S rRNA (cytosine967-C5)-methyltransferase